MVQVAQSCGGYPITWKVAEAVCGLDALVMRHVVKESQAGAYLTHKSRMDSTEDILQFCCQIEQTELVFNDAFVKMIREGCLSSVLMLVAQLSKPVTLTFASAVSDQIETTTLQDSAAGKEERY
jgi:hypothetical protein